MSPDFLSLSVSFSLWVISYLWLHIFFLRVARPERLLSVALADRPGFLLLQRNCERGDKASDSTCLHPGGGGEM